MTTMIIVGVMVLLVFVWLIPSYNKGVILHGYVRKTFSTMDAYLKKRWDLIPDLLETVKDYAAHEKSILEEVTQLCSSNYGGMDADQKIDINQRLNIGITKLLTAAENYPELKANENFSNLIGELFSIENKIVSSRKYYNGAVSKLNTYTEVFPSNIICVIFGIKRKQLFEIDDI